MDMYGIPAPESFRIDDLLDFSNSELFSSSTPADQSSDLHPHFPSSFTQSSNIHLPNKTHLTDFTDNLYLPNEEVAELEWLSNFVDDSFTDFTTNELANVVNLQQPETNTTFHSRSRSKRSRATSTNNVNGWIISTEANIMEKTPTGGVRKRDNNSAEQQDMARRCTHCASEKTPQWRTGPLGPKTLCNACGVRYKSGRLVPEYRPAASPTFVLTQHSNSHRKVMELRRQKEIVKQEHEQQLFHHHHHVHQYHHQQQQTQKNFEVC